MDQLPHWLSQEASTASFCVIIPIAQGEKRRHLAKVTQLLGGGTGVVTQKSDARAAISAVQEEHPFLVGAGGAP